MPGYNTIGSGISSAGDDIAAGITRAWLEHERAKRAEGQFDAITRIVRDDSGNIYPDAGMVPKDVKAKPVFDSSFTEGVKQSLGNNKAYRAGSLDAWSRIIAQSVARKQASDVEDASVSGQRAAQGLQQDIATAADKQALLKAQVKREQGLADQSDKQWVPGFGYMTPTQLSQHNARQERIAAAKEKLDPFMKFQNSLMTNYGLSVQDVANASQSKFEVGAGKQTTQATGVPYVNMVGKQISAEEAMKTFDPRTNPIYAKVPPNGTMIPLPEWQQILSTSQNFMSRKPSLDKAQQTLDNESATMQQQQAKTTIGIIQSKDPSTLTDQDKAALQKAQSILGTGQ